MKNVSDIIPENVPAIAFAGWSGSGKTTLLEKLIPALKDAVRNAGMGDLRIGVIKHDAHGICLTPSAAADPEAGACGAGSESDSTENPAHMRYTDIKGKDSRRFREAGADRVVLCGPEGIFVSCAEDMTQMRKVTIAKEVQQKETGLQVDRDLPEAQNFLRDMDLILVEGFKNSSLPQIGIAWKGNGKGLTAEPERFLAIVTDDPDVTEQDTLWKSKHPIFSFDQVRELADQIVQDFL